MRRFALAAALAGLAAGVTATSASAGNVRALDTSVAGIGHAATDSASKSRAVRSSAFSGSGRAVAAPSPYLPGARENFELVGKWDVPNVFRGQIADLAVYNGFAYLNSWDDPACAKGGFYVVDVRDPANPKSGPFVPAVAPYYHGEGAHVMKVSTPQFSGDILAVNNETYSKPCGGLDKTGGGFDLYDVTDPMDPKPLVQVAGDKAPDGALAPQSDPAPNSYHSVLMWQDGPRAYLVGVDNTELADVDVFDITDPKNPEQIGDWDLVEKFPQIMGDAANGQTVFHHDTVVKRIDGKMVMKVDYWDAGYVQLDVSDPKNPKYITDTNFAGPDPLTGFDPPEGNAHQGEFSYDNQFLLAADEDFSPFRTDLSAPTGPKPAKKPTVNEGDAKPIAELPDGKLNGPTTWAGDGCDATPGAYPPAAAADTDPNTDRIALIERGTCGFTDKFANAAANGFDGVVIYNNAGRSDGDPSVNMSTQPGGTIPGVHMKRADAVGSEGVLSASDPAPASGTAGPDIDIAQRFDGWGYAHLYDAKTSQELGAYAIPESLDPRYAVGFGDLSIHEFATDPATNVAYSSYYAGGLRAFQFSRAQGLVPTGKYIEEDGSNYWGVEQFTTPGGQRLVAGSDRDKGLRILKYTGPGAPQPPAAEAPKAPEETPPAPPQVATTAGTRFTVSVRRKLRRGTGRMLVLVTAPTAGTVSTQLRTKIGGRTVTLGRVTKKLPKAGTYVFSVKVSKSKLATLKRALRRTKSKRLTATLPTSWKPTSGKTVQTTRSTIIR